MSTTLMSGVIVTGGILDFDTDGMAVRERGIMELAELMGLGGGGHAVMRARGIAATDLVVSHREACARVMRELAGTGRLPLL